jgi:hypothetical protein
MSYSPEPDQEERYIHPEHNLTLVVRHWDDIPDFCNWYTQDSNDTVYDADSTTNKDLKIKVKAEGWKLIK